MSPLAKISSAFAPRFAEIRERLQASHPGLVPRQPHREDLADHALGFLDALDELDWREPVGHDYAVCRLTAISWLVERHGLLAAPTD